MPTFAELLTKYVARAGIGDAELARRIRISRLTLIRWKEGVTSRPRYREDVVRCADVLRLSSDEREELLTAAGFDPNNPPDAPAAAATVDSTEAAAEPLVVAPHRLSRTFAISGAAVLLVVVGLVYFFLLRPEGQPNFPVAADGESVILMAPFVNYTGGQQGFNIQGRLADEVERAVSTAGLANVRVVEWTDPISTETEAADAALKSRADMVIWGEYDSGRAMANFTVPSQPQGQGGYNPQVVDISLSPADLPTSINEALTGEVRTVALMVLGQLYLERDEHDLAKAALSEAMAQQPVNPDTLAGIKFRLGLAYMGGTYADLDEAVWLFTQVLAVRPRSVDTLNNRALAYLERGREGDVALAVDDLTRALGLEPRSAGTYLNRGVAYLRFGDRHNLSRSIADFEKAIELDPEYSRAYVNRASAYLQRGDERDLERAFDDIDKALSIDPKLAIGYVNRGNAYLQRGQNEDLGRAGEEYSKAIELEPKSATAYYNRGLMFSALLGPSEDWTDSTDDLLRAQELEPRNFAFNNTLCWQLGVQRRPDEALPYCNVALEERPEGLVFDSLGLVYAVMGKYDEAVTNFESFLAWVGTSQKDACRNHYQPSRVTWINDLKAGVDPFSDELLRELRIRPAPPSVVDIC